MDYRMKIVLIVAALTAFCAFVVPAPAEVRFWLTVVAVPALATAPALIDRVSSLNYQDWDYPNGEVAVFYGLGFSLIALICCLLITALPMHFFDWLAPNVLSLIGGSLLALVVWFLYGTVREAGVMAIIPILFFSTAYVFGAIAGANSILDGKAPEVFRTTVIDKVKSTGKGTKNTVSLEPAGPFRGETPYDVHYREFDELVVGNVACAYVYHGAYGWRHYVIRHCPN
jgi:hypothetical protein